MTPNSQKTSYSLDEVMQMYGSNQSNVQPSIQAAQEASNQSNVPFPYQGGEGGLKSGLKAAGNYGASIINFGKSALGAAKSALTNPVETGKFVSGLVSDISPIGRATSLFTGEGTQTPFLDKAKEAVTTSVKDRYGTLDKAQKTAIEDPFGVGSDILGVLTGGAGMVGKGALATKTISTVGQAVTSPLARTASGFSAKVANTVKFGASQATGLSPETISTVVNNRKAFNTATKAGTSRTDLAENVLDAVNKAGDELSDLGAGYDEIRAVQADVALPETWLQDSLNKYGLKFQNTKVSADKSSATRNVTDINKIQEFIDNWGDSRTLTPTEYLNMRHDLSELAKYEVASGKSSVVQQFAQDVREGILNSEKVRGQIPGLKDLDNKYAADKTFFKQMEKDFINKQTGGLKDGAASKVVNAVNAANPERLARLEKLYPGFTQQAKVVKAIEDVENSMGIKTGTYVRAGVAVSAAVSGNLPLVVGAILSTPEIALPLIKGYGWTAEQVAPILKVAREVAGDINNFRVPGAVEKYLKEKYPNGVPVGMSIQDVTKQPNFNKGATPQTTALLEEAKKYKSAEEISLPNQVEQLPTKLFHGTEKSDVTTQNIGEGMKVTWFAEDKNISSKYIGGGEIGKKGNILEFNTPQNLKLYDAYSTGEGNYNDSQWLKSLEEQGYDGVRMHDAARFEVDLGSGPYWDKKAHPSVGLFSSGVAKLKK